MDIKNNRKCNYLGRYRQLCYSVYHPLICLVRPEKSWEILRHNGQPLCANPESSEWKVSSLLTFLRSFSM